MTDNIIINLRHLGQPPRTLWITHDVHDPKLGHSVHPTEITTPTTTYNIIINLRHLGQPVRTLWITHDVGDPKLGQFLYPT